MMPPDHDSGQPEHAPQEPPRAALGGASPPPRYATPERAPPLPPRAAKPASGRAPGNVSQLRHRLDPKEPFAAACRFRLRYAVEGVPGLHHWRGDFLAWAGTHYDVTSEATYRAEFYRGLQDQGDKPNRRHIGDLIDALRSACFLPESIEAPGWLPGYDGADPAELVAVSNGLLNTRTRTLAPPEPRLFATSALPVAYYVNAPEPIEWLGFLGSIWPDDPQTIEALQEWFGLVALTEVTRYQKALLICGPKRSGKGTILRVLRELAGPANTVAPTLGELGERFGLQPLIGKRLAIVSDARLSGRADVAAIAEAILRISGEDAVTVQRKHREDWTGKLPTRFVIASNELPTLADASAALSSRFIVLSMRRSFFGEEDPGLTDRLLEELPGILLWSLQGLDRLRVRGRLLQPETGRELASALESLSSPISSFIADECVVEAWASIERLALFNAWREWCNAHGVKEAGTEANFGKKLRAALPNLGSKRGASGGSRVRMHTGIRLRSLADPD
ncbi:MAG: phage/plasmid primase, P4 family [Lysobacterales bacterium]